MKKILVFAILATITLCINAQLCDLDLNKPFGWCNCISTKKGGYTVNGADAIDKAYRKTITIVSTGKDQSNEVMQDILAYDVIIFDGSKGDIVFDRSISLYGIHNKTIVGINNARICTKFVLTPELHQMLNKADLMKASTQASDTIYTLPNGAKIKEKREYLTRKTFVDAGFKDEDVRASGLFSMKNCENVIMRNLSLQGPGSVDVGGNDLLTLTSCEHMWIDHCTFTDGIDGNFDINHGSDFISVTWCVFQYTERAYDHMNTNLIGANDRDAEGLNKHNITFAFCMWGNRCRQRMPMARNGIFHILSCYYNCPGNGVCVNPRKGANFIVEGCAVAEGVKFFSQKDAISCKIKDGVYGIYFDEKSPEYNFGTTPKLPYQYEISPAQQVIGATMKYAGATLQEPLNIVK